MNTAFRQIDPTIDTGADSDDYALGVAEDDSSSYARAGGATRCRGTMVAI